MPYASIQAIREGAGLLSRVESETPDGIIDGTNKKFVTIRRPLVDSDYDDDVSVDDVNAYVNNASVEVASINAKTGEITLEEAPAVDTSITVDYSFSAITDEYVAGKQDEADSWINNKLKGIRNLEVPVNPAPPMLSTVAELYAAALILIRDWGSRADTELTSKDGYNKLKSAKDLLNEYIEGVKNQTSQDDRTAGAGQVTVLTDSDVFARNYPVNDIDREEAFWRRPGQV